VDARALGVQLLFVGQFGLQAGDLAGQLRAVEVRRRRRLGLLSLGLGSTFCGFRRLGGTADFGRGGRLGLAAGGGVILLILLSWNGATSVVLGTAFVQGAAALLVFLGLEIGLLGRFRS
jgi:hypothetical protein